MTSQTELEERQTLYLKIILIGTCLVLLGLLLSALFISVELMTRPDALSILALAGNLVACACTISLVRDVVQQIKDTKIQN